MIKADISQEAAFVLMEERGWEDVRVQNFGKFWCVWGSYRGQSHSGWRSDLRSLIDHMHAMADQIDSGQEIRTEPPPVKTPKPVELTRYRTIEKPVERVRYTTDPRQAREIERLKRELQQANRERLAAREAAVKAAANQPMVPEPIRKLMREGESVATAYGRLFPLLNREKVRLRRQRKVTSVYTKREREVDHLIGLLASMAKR